MAGKADLFSVANPFHNVSNMITIKECIEYPCRIHSPGIWEYFRSGTFPFSLPQLELQMILIFAITQISHYILKPYGVPPYTSQLIAGIILGPSLLGRFRIIKDLFSIRSQEIIGVLAYFGHVLFLFLSSVKMDIRVVNRMGRKALCTGIACILSPLLIGLSLQRALQRYWLTKEETNSLPFLTLIHSLTPFPVVVYLLEHLKILNSELGQLALSAALVSDMIGVFLYSVAGLFGIAMDKGISQAIIVVGSSIVYTLVIVFAVRPAMFWIVRQTPQGRPVKGTYINIIMLMMLGSELLSLLLGPTFFFGPYILGLAIPDGPPLGSTIVKKFDYFTQAVFHPLFVTTCAMRTDLRAIKFNSSFMKYNAIRIVSFAAKLGGCLVPPLYSKMPLNDALALSLILSFKGVIQQGFYTFIKLFEVQSIADEVRSLSSIFMLLNGIIVPILVKHLYDPLRKYAGYQKRDIMHCRLNAELRILVCIHRLDNVAPAIKLLEASCPSRERPLAIFVLHLIKLIGRACPIFISHQMQKNSASKTSYSENVIAAFNHFKRDNQVAGSVDVFTAITPPKFMHDDICNLALEKLTSLIVLPFHRKWSIDGSIESEDNTIRTLNCNVLELAPCSVGILVDRGHLGRSKSSYSVAMIFLGGDDDREALTFAKRMANDSNITLTVVHFVASCDEDLNHWDKLFDYEELKDVKLNNVGDEYVTYKEKIVKDGPQMTLIVRFMVHEYDLIIVGRRHNLESPQTSGLLEWSEFSELGIVGDLLASSDLNSRTSVLVVQQQQKMS